MLAMMAAGAFTAYSIALRSAIHAYDRALLDTALALAGQIREHNGKLDINLPKAAEEILLTDKFDLIFFRVLASDGHDIAGDQRLPLPPDISPINSWMYYDAIVDGKTVRVAALFTEHDGLPLTILSAETLLKRQSLVREILLGMLLPELALVCITLALIWFGVRSGLHPLEELRKALANRSQNDLSPIVAPDPTYEIMPVIGELNRLLQQLDESLQAQRHFVSDAAHQLRTPIAAMQTQLELMLRETKDLSRSQVKQVLSATQRLAHLVHQLLALARAEPKDTTTRQIVNLDLIVRELADSVLSRALSRGIDLGFELESATVRGSALLLQEAISNLIDNAIRYTPAPGTVTVSCRPTEKGTILVVEDSGNGIPEELHNQVFERFYRIPGSKDDGCGLGLSIVRQIARQHGAKVRISKSRGLGGAAVTIFFPKIDYGLSS